MCVLLSSRVVPVYMAECLLVHLYLYLSTLITDIIYQIFDLYYIIYQIFDLYYSLLAKATQLTQLTYDNIQEKLNYISFILLLVFPDLLIIIINLQLSLD